MLFAKQDNTAARNWAATFHDEQRANVSAESKAQEVLRHSPKKPITD